MNLRKGSARVVAGVAAALSAALVLGACGGGADRAAAPAESDPAVSEATSETPDEAAPSESTASEATSEAPDEVAPSEASAEASDSSEEVSPSESAIGDAPVGLRGSKATYVNVENRLADWWGGNGIPITWRVTKTENKFWDGASRPDNAPPKGLQGLVQDPKSGSYAVRLEVNDVSVFDTPRTFVLTPVATIDGQQLPLSSILFSFESRKRVPELGQGIGIDVGWQITSGGQVCAPGSSAPAQTKIESWTERTPRGDLVYDVVLTCPFRTDGPAEVLIRNYKRQ